MVKTVSTRNWLLSVSALASLGVVGCVDARGAYDDFSGRLVDGGSGDVDGEVVSELPDVDGEWYLAVRPNLPEDRIIQFRATLDLTAVTSNTGLIAINAQPLSVADQPPVGEAFVATDAEVASDASFDAPFVGVLPGAANPISGSDAAVDANMLAQIRSADFVCGELTGQAGPLPLAGTTFAAVRITGDTLPTPIFRCEDQPQ
jgi:hypothetical protein